MRRKSFYTRCQGSALKSLAVFALIAPPYVASCISKLTLRSRSPPCLAPFIPSEIGNDRAGRNAGMAASARLSGGCIYPYISLETSAESPLGGPLSQKSLRGALGVTARRRA